jgi:hypothetical protein
VFTNLKYTDHTTEHIFFKKKTEIDRKKIIPGVTRFKVGSGVREGGDWFARSRG